MITHRVPNRRFAQRLLCSLRLARVLVSALALASTPALACNGTIYLTFDTGSMSQADFIARTLQQFKARATFFLANEKTIHGDHSLDPGWANWWRERVAEGHAFGSHTFDHIVVQRDAPGGRIVVKPGFGPDKGQQVALSAGQYCRQLRTVDQRFAEMTGTALDPVWRAPAGRLSPNALAAARRCGYQHVAWSEAGFSGDELPSETWPNATLLAKSLRELKDGDIFMAHLGIWSRKDAWAPGNLPTLLARLQHKGFCFATLREHPQYAHWIEAQKHGPRH